jgi:predicted TPR repeat methyltransferase
LTLQDLSDAMLERARRSIPPSFENCVKTVGGDFLQAVLPPKAYDIVICLGVLSYIMDLNAFLAKVASLVAPRGHLIIECTDGAHFLSKLWAAYSRLTGLVRKPAVRIALQAHAARTVGRTLRNRGFALAGTYRYSAPPPVIRRFFGQRFHSGVNQILHGDAAHNRLAWLGAECIFHFQQTAAAQIQPDGGHE